MLTNSLQMSASSARRLGGKIKRTKVEKMGGTPSCEGGGDGDAQLKPLFIRFDELQAETFMAET